MTSESSAPRALDGRPSPPGVYLYCVGRADALDPLGPVGLGGEEVRVVRQDALAGLVSDLPAGARVDAGLPARASLLAHEFVTGAAMRRRTVVPAAFGLVFRTDADVAAVITATNEAIDGALESLADRVQVSVRLVWTGDSPVPAGGEQVGAMYEALREVAVANRSRPPIGERMLRNVAFLVDRERLAAFDAVLDELRGRHLGQLEYRASAPSAPCDFVRVRLRVDRADGPGSGHGRA
jgi:hypothetical protein